MTTLELDPGRTGWLNRDELRRAAGRCGLTLSCEEPRRMVFSPENKDENAGNASNPPEAALARFLDSIGGTENIDVVTVKTRREHAQSTRALLARRGYYAVEDKPASLLGTEDILNPAQRGCVMFETVR